MTVSRQKTGSSYRIALVVAIVIHLALILAMTLEIKSPSYKQLHLSSNTKVVNAHAITMNQVQQQIQRVDDIKQAKLEKKRLVELRKKRLREQRLAAIKRQKELVAKKKAQALARAKAAADAKRLAEVKAKAAAALKAKQMAEAKAKRLAEAKAKAEQEEQRRTALKKQQQELQQALLDQQLQSEQANITRIQQQATNAMVDRYKTAILQAISQSWLVPAGVDKKLKCELLIHLGPGGVVLSVKTIQSSGNSALDRSAATAVYKSSPLPVPKDPAVFDKFRELRLTVRPESIVAS